MGKFEYTINIKRISPKAEKLLGFTFRHLQDTLTEIGALNLGLFIGRTNGFRPASLWRKSFNGNAYSISSVNTNKTAYHLPRPYFSKKWKTKPRRLRT